MDQTWGAGSDNKGGGGACWSRGWMVIWGMGKVIMVREKMFNLSDYRSCFSFHFLGGNLVIWDPPTYS